MAWSWKKLKAAKKNLIRRAVVVLVAYEAVFLATMFWVDRTRPEGSMLFAAALLPTVTVVDEVLRSISGAGALPPFTSWVTFFLAFGVAQAVQTMRNRARDDA